LQPLPVDFGGYYGEPASRATRAATPSRDESAGGSMSFGRGHGIAVATMKLQRFDEVVSLEKLLAVAGSGVW